MVLKRRAPYRRPARPMKKRRMTKRPIPRGLRPAAPSAMLVKRTFYAGNWTFGTVTTNDFWRYGVITLSNLPSASDFTALFDEYKINAIKVTYRPSYDSVPSDAPALNVNTGPQSFAHIVVDPGSTLIPTGTYNSTTLNTFLENSGVRTVTTNKPFSIFWKPKIRVQAAGGGTTSEVRKGGYMRTSDTGVVYTGYHMFLQQNNFATSNTRIALDSYVTLYMSFRNLR